MELLETVDIPEEGEATPSVAFGYTTLGEFEEGVKELSGVDVEDFVSDIVELFDKYEGARSSGIEAIWKNVKQLLKPPGLTKEGALFKSKLPYAIQIKNTLQAHIWSRSLQTDKILFSVEGKGEQAKEVSPLYKEALLNHFRPVKLPKKLDRLAADLIEKGVAIGFVGRLEKFRKVRVQSGQMGTSELYDSVEGELMFTETEVKLADTANLTRVDPYSFVFDTECDDFDRAYKAYCSPFTYEQIATNPNFTQYDELLEYKKEMAANKKSKTDSLMAKINPKGKDEAVKSGFYPDGRIEVIEAYGDFRLPNGDYVENCCVVIAARKYLLRFEPNPFYVNPFVMMTYNESAGAWGDGGPIAHATALIEGASRMASQGANVAEYAMNPPYLSPKGALENKVNRLQPGSILEYEPNIALPNVLPQPIPFNFNPAFPFIQLFESQTEATTGATRQLSGNVTTNDKAQTATEFTGLQVIGNMVMDRTIDLFNLELKLPIIEKMALIQAMFNPEPMEVKAEDDSGKTEYKQVDASAYYHEYDFRIEDLKSENERKQNVQQKIALIQQMAQVPELAAKAEWRYIFNAIWRDLGYGDAHKFVMEDEEYAVHLGKQAGIQQLAQSMAQQFALMFGNSPEVQQALMQPQGGGAYDQALVGQQQGVGGIVQQAQSQPGVSGPGGVFPPQVGPGFAGEPDASSVNDAF
jgi:hypothetical protein